MAVLRYIDDAGQLQTKSVEAEAFLLGRATTCQLVLIDDTISREHLRIDREDGGRFRVRDLGSRNKTFVNGELITETLLNSGDIIRAGARVVEFLDDTPSRDRIDLEFLTPDRTEPPGSQWIRPKTPLSLTSAQVEQIALLCGDPAVLTRAEDIAEAAVGQVLLDLQAERGLIALRGDEKTELRPLAHRALKRPSGGSMTPVSQSFILAPILQGVAGRYPQAVGDINTKLGYAAAALVAPLTFRSEVIGVLYVDRPIPKKPFSPADLQYAQAAGAHVGALVADASRRLVRSASRESAAWMSALRRMQHALTTPTTASDSFDVAVACYPGRSRCGDFGDLIHLDEQRCAIVVIDGGGQGMAGLAQAAAIRTAIRTGLALAPAALLDPTAMFASISDMIARSQARKVVPCTFIGIDLSAGRLVYVNAGGQPPLLMLGPGRLVTLDQSSLVLGVAPDQPFTVATANLPATFRIVCHTDGLTEGGNSAGEPLSDQRVHEALLDREAFAAPAAVLAKIDAAWKAHLAGAHAEDDALVIVVGRG